MREGVGTVTVICLSTKEKWTRPYHRAVTTVALHPDYEHRKAYACGGLGQQVIVNTRGDGFRPRTMSSMLVKVQCMPFAGPSL